MRYAGSGSKRPRAGNRRGSGRHPDTLAIDPIQPHVLRRLIDTVDAQNESMRIGKAVGLSRTARELIFLPKALVTPSEDRGPLFENMF
ncbi:hypothetical protein MHY1_01900 [Methylovirgula sp. HY1]|nr:hypothetical protein MHY1_01900 [Methylovirgula sp. HY1]